MAPQTDGKRAVFGSYDGTLTVSDIETGEALRTLVGHGGWISAVALTPDGKLAVSASADRSVIVWDLEAGALLASFSGEGTMHACAVASNSSTIVAGESTGRFHVLKLEGLT